MKRSIHYSILRFAASAAIVSAIVFLYFRWLHVNPTTVGFSLLLAVLLISATWGLRYAIFTAIVATVAYNYFFLPPLFRFTIADPQNWVALLAFLVTAVVASQLSERERRGTIYADQRRHEVERLSSPRKKGRPSIWQLPQPQKNGTRSCALPKVCSHPSLCWDLRPPNL
ncbi:MAG TPA: DUF4118 domain-containing protein [Terriglobales bacterium]|nr:DUF4118 domain-containing protein [Terriglobales bacterium]